MNISGKYLKDESGNTISPVTSVDTIFNGSTTLKSFLSGTVIYNGSSVTTPQSSITLTSSILGTRVKIFLRSNANYNDDTRRFYRINKSSSKPII